MIPPLTKKWSKKVKQYNLLLINIIYRLKTAIKQNIKQRVKQILVCTFWFITYSIDI